MGVRVAELLCNSMREHGMKDVAGKPAMTVVQRIQKRATVAEKQPNDRGNAMWLTEMFA
jgi:hypothetical protein